MDDFYTLEQDTQAYSAGTVLRNVTLRQARNMECNRCGDCCNGLSEHVKKDPTTGLPLFVWGSKFPNDLYESRYGKRMLQPIGFLDNSDEMPYQGRIGLVDKFENDDENKPYTCFSCNFHRQLTPDFSTCTLKETYPNPDPDKLEQIRPLNCGEFPVFSTAVDDTIIDGHSFVPATGSLPRCTWHGLRIVGPYKDEPYWIDRWNKQQNGESVDDLSIPVEVVEALEKKSLMKRGKSDSVEGSNSVSA